MSIYSMGGRTFLLTAGAGIVSSLLCWFGKIGGGEYVAVITITVGAYIGGNTVQKVKETNATQSPQ